MVITDNNGYLARQAIDDNDWIVSGADVYRPSGNVGIGTNAPAEQLHIVGDLRISTGRINSTSNTLHLLEGTGADDTSYEYVGYYSGGTRQGIILYDGQWSGANNVNNEFSITAENNNLLTLNTEADRHIALMPKGTGNVGIGSLSPIAKLVVAGDINFVNNALIANGAASSTNVDHVWYDDASTNGADGTWHFVADNSYKTAGSARLEGHHVAMTGGSANYMNGSLGLGTAAPNEKLQVVGNIRLDNNAILSVDGSYFGTGSYGIGNEGDDLSINVAGNGELEVQRNGAGVLTVGDDVSFQQDVYWPNAILGSSRNTGQFNGAAGYDFQDNGVLLENNDGESGGFMATGNSAFIWSPGDGPAGTPTGSTDPATRLLSFLDEDGMTERSWIDGDGDYFKASDAKLKQNIAPIQDALTKLAAIGGYTYSFKLHPEERRKGQRPAPAAGVLAQEVQAVLPSAVRPSLEGNLAVSYDQLVPLLIQAINEQQAAMKARNAEIEALRERIVALEGAQGQ
jgi:hypothetical protein